MTTGVMSKPRPPLIPDPFIARSRHSPIALIITRLTGRSPRVTVNRQTDGLSNRVMDESDKLESIPGREDKMAARTHGLALTYVMEKLNHLESRAAAYIYRIVSNIAGDEIRI